MLVWKPPTPEYALQPTLRLPVPLGKCISGLEHLNEDNLQNQLTETMPCPESDFIYGYWAAQGRVGIVPCGLHVSWSGSHLQQGGRAEQFMLVHIGFLRLVDLLGHEEYTWIFLFKWCEKIKIFIDPWDKCSSSIIMNGTIF